MTVRTGTEWYYGNLIQFNRYRTYIRTHTSQVKSRTFLQHWPVRRRPVSVAVAVSLRYEMEVSIGFHIYPGLFQRCSIYREGGSAGPKTAEIYVTREGKLPAVLVCYAAYQFSSASFPPSRELPHPVTLTGRLYRKVSTHFTNYAPRRTKLYTGRSLKCIWRQTRPSNVEVLEVYYSPNTFRVIKSETVRWVWHVTRFEERKMYTGLWWGKLRERDH